MTNLWAGLKFSSSFVCFVEDPSPSVGGAPCWSTLLSWMVWPLFYRICVCLSFKILKNGDLQKHLHLKKCNRALSSGVGDWPVFLGNKFFQIAPQLEVDPIHELRIY